MDDELDRFKRINLCAFATSRGYRLIRREGTRSRGSRGSTASSLLLRHPATDDKIVARIDHDGHWTYFSVRDDRDNGTIIDFILRRGARTLKRHLPQQPRDPGRQPVPSEDFSQLPWVLTSREAANVLRLGVREVRALVDSGELPGTRVGSRKVVRISRATVLALLGLQSAG